MDEQKHPQSDWKAKIKRWIPPAAIDAVRRDPIGIRVGQAFPTWRDAEIASGSNYSADLLTRFRVERSHLNGRQKNAKDYLLTAAMLLGTPSLEVTDFGGSTGDHGTRLLEVYPRTRYTVVETDPLVEAARGSFPGVVFTKALPSSCDIFFTSGTLQYLKDPYELAKSAFRSARFVCIFLRNSFSATEMFHIQESDLFSNGGGTIPNGYKNSIVRYPHRTVLEARLLSLAEAEGFISTARIPDPGPVWPSRAGAYGADLIFIRASL